jgi:tetratricopeptide (TPR) repeat protein
MKSKKGGNKKGKKGGGGKKKGGGGKKPPQQPPKGDDEPGFVLPEAEKALVPGYGCMVTKRWEEAYQKGHFALMIEIARANMQRYWDKVTDVQSKASLLHMLGDSLVQTAEGEALKEGRKYDLEARELIRSIGERSTQEILYGVWPEDCVFAWGAFFEQQVDASGRNAEMEWMLEMINLTRRTINSELERFADNAKAVEMLRFLSRKHYTAEFLAIDDLLSSLDLLSLNDAERWLARFGKRIEEIETINEREGWNLTAVKASKSNQLERKCRLYERQGKAELALELIRKALQEKEDDPRVGVRLDDLHVEMCLKLGQIEEAFKSMEKIFSVFRSEGIKAAAVNGFGEYRSLVPVESRLLFAALVPRYPHVLWAASGGGFTKLSEEQNKILRSHLEVKKGLRCVNCNKELTKIYRCSRCEIATYCGSACQKEAWKEHKKICKKREETE